MPFNNDQLSHMKKSSNRNRNDEQTDILNCELKPTLKLAETMQTTPFDTFASLEEISQMRFGSFTENATFPIMDTKIEGAFVSKELAEMKGILLKQSEEMKTMKSEIMNYIMFLNSDIKMNVMFISQQLGEMRQIVMQQSEEAKETIWEHSEEMKETVSEQSEEVKETVLEQSKKIEQMMRLSLQHKRNIQINSSVKDGYDKLKSVLDKARKIVNSYLMKLLSKRGVVLVQGKLFFNILLRHILNMYRKCRSSLPQIAETIKLLFGILGGICIIILWLIFKTVQISFKAFAHVLIIIILVIYDYKIHVFLLLLLFLLVYYFFL